MKITDKIGLKHQNEVVKNLYMKHSVRTVLDLGGGKNPQFNICKDLGIKQLIIDNFYPEADLPVASRKVNILDFAAVESVIIEVFGSHKVDCVVAIQLIEHLTKEDGNLLLKKVEEWSNKLVIFETPNGFVEQGAVDGNIYQIHLSGWGKKDFRSLGYKVNGTSGFKFLKKASDKGQYKLQIRGVRLLDVIFSRLLLIHYFPSLNFNLIAYKKIEKSG
jgi:hypothetical protein